MLIHPVQVSERYPIGSIVESYLPPGDGWILCDGQVVAQADYPELYAISEDPHPDFEDWDILEASIGDGFYLTTQGNSLFIGGGIGDTLYYSSDGIVWSTSNVTSTLNNAGFDGGLVYDGTTFVAVPGNYSPYTDYFTSTDGQTWTARVFPVAIEGRGLCHDGTNFYITSEDGGTCLYSSDGLTWSLGAALPALDWKGLAVSSSKMVAVSWSGDLAVSSDSMLTWKLYQFATGSLQRVIYDSADDIFVVAGYYDALYATSAGDDGLEWDVRYLPDQYGTDHDYYAIKKAGSYWFAMRTSHGLLNYSKDLKTWNTIPTIYTEWYDIEYNSTTGYYILYGYGNYIMRFKEVDEYDTSTYFKIPKAHKTYNKMSLTKEYKYIRVK